MLLIPEDEFTRDLHLETARLSLRPYREADRRDFTRLVSNPRLMEFMGGPAPRPDRLFESLLNPDRQSVDLGWAITWLDGGDYLGHIWIQGLHGSSPPQLGFVIAEEHQSQYVATEASGAVLRHSLEALELPVLEATVDGDHLESRRVLEKIGMVLDRTEHDADGPYLVYSRSSPEAST